MFNHTVDHSTRARWIARIREPPGVTQMEKHTIVSRDEWIEAREQLLAREKEFTRLRDQLSQQRRDLPWVRVDKQYVFDGPNGNETLSELFDGRSQLIVYHFMFDPSWEAGCKSCSFWADNSIETSCTLGTVM